MLLEPQILLKVIKNKDLENFNRLKAHYFSGIYEKIYKNITKYYEKNNVIPNFEELKLNNQRNSVIFERIFVLEKTDELDVDIDVLIDGLVDQYTQDLALDKIEDLIESITVKDSEEIKDDINNMALFLEEKTHDSEEIFFMNDIPLIDEKELLSRVPLGLNNDFDQKFGGMGLTELWMLGGERGSGKSVVSGNIAVNQYLAKNSVLFFSIEMRAREIYTRMLSSLSGVNHLNIRNGKLTTQEYIKIAKIRSAMFHESDEVYNDYRDHLDYAKFELQLNRDKQLKNDNQIVIVDNNELTLTDIDINIQKMKARFKDKLKVVVVDYLNQINVPDMYEWKTQISISKKLKSLAKKHDVLLVTPYQIDKTGEARFSKGILDAADIACILSKPEENLINIKSTKTRNISAFDFTSGMDWDILRVDPTYIQEEYIESEEDSEKPADIL